MIGFAMEIPVGYLGHFTEHTNLDFALTHQVLGNEEYASFYASRPKGRELILDNSMHELGAALPLTDVRAAAERVHADYVIIPDNLDDAEWTLRQMDEAAVVLKGFKLAANLVGDHEAQRRRVRNAALCVADMLCLPYRRNRLDWFLSDLKLHLFPRVHLLGMSSLTELRAWTYVARMFPMITFSIDTSKPIKWGICGRRIDDGQDLRNAPVASAALLNVTQLPASALECIDHNVQFLRGVLNGHVNPGA